MKINLSKNVKLKRKIPQNNGLDDFVFAQKPPIPPTSKTYAPVPPLSLNRYDIVPDTTYDMSGNSKMQPYTLGDKIKMAGYSLGLGIAEDAGFEYSMKKQSPGIGQLYAAFDIGRDLKNAYNVFNIKPYDRYAKVDVYGNRVKDGDWKNEWKRQSGPIPGTIDWDGKEPEITDEWHKQYANGGMIKDNQMKRINRYAGGGLTFGTNMNKLDDSIGGAVNLATGLFSSTAGTSVRDAQTKSWTQPLSGALSGAQTGQMFGPAGMAIGAGVGLLTGAIGNGGGIDATNGFTQDNSYRYSTGLHRLFGGSGESAKFAEDREDIMKNRMAVQNTMQLQNDWNTSKNYTNAQYMYARGGITGGSYAYVDDGEVVQQQNGQTQIIPERGRKQDSNLGYFPAGSMILSDKLKFPGTRKTFADISKERMAKISSGTDKYAEGTNALNMMYNAETNRDLFALQEAYKKKHGIKSDYKRIPKASGGLLTKPDGKWNAKGYTPGTEKTQVGANGEAYFDEKLGVWNMGSGASAYNLGQLGGPIAGANMAPQGSTYDVTLGKSQYGQFDPQGIEKTYATRVAAGLTGGGPSGSNGGSDIFGSILGGASKLAGMLPAISNLRQKPEYIGEEYNPYENIIKGNLSKRRFNVNPLLEQINRTAMTGNYNANQMGAGTGANMAYRATTNIGQQQQVSAAMAQKQNIDNQYMGEYANMLNTLGQQRVQAKNYATDYNARNRAAADNARQAGLSQISQFAQTQLLEKNQKERDKMMMKLYGPFLSRGFDSATMSDLTKYFG
jgi:hypothetical protein